MRPTGRKSTSRSNAVVCPFRETIVENREYEKSVKIRENPRKSQTFDFVYHAEATLRTRY